MSQEKKEQIPTDDGPESKTGKVINDQNAIEGQRKEVNVEDLFRGSKIRPIVKGFRFSSPKKQDFTVYQTGRRL